MKLSQRLPELLRTAGPAAVVAVLEEDPRGVVRAGVAMLGDPMLPGLAAAEPTTAVVATLCIMARTRPAAADLLEERLDGHPERIGLLDLTRLMRFADADRWLDLLERNLPGPLWLPLVQDRAPPSVRWSSRAGPGAGDEELLARLLTPARAAPFRALLADPGTRRRTVQRIDREMPGRPWIPMLSPLLDDPRPSVRTATARALARVGGDTSSVLRDPSARVREAAVVGSRDVDALRAALRDLDLRVRAAAVDALVGAEEAPPPEAFSDPDPRVREAAVRRHGAPSAVDDPDPDVRREAAWRHPDPPPALLDDPRPDVRLALVARTPRAELLKAALGDPEPRIRRLAGRRLRRGA